eukprot:1988881-Prymnesium_polylepis.1
MSCFAPGLRPAAHPRLRADCSRSSRECTSRRATRLTEPHTSDETRSGCRRLLQNPSSRATLTHSLVEGHERASRALRAPEGAQSDRGQAQGAPT